MVLLILTRTIRCFKRITGDYTHLYKISFKKTYFGIPVLYCTQQFSLTIWFNASVAQSFESVFSSPLHLRLGIVCHLLLINYPYKLLVTYITERRMYKVHRNKTESIPRGLAGRNLVGIFLLL